MLITTPLLLVWVASVAVAITLYLGNNDDDNQPPTACVTN